MGIIVDIIIIAIFAICIIIGYIKGLTGAILKIVSFVLALVIAFILFKPIANFVVANTNWDENLEQAIKSILIKENEGNIEENNNIEANSKNNTNGTTNDKNNANSKNSTNGINSKTNGKSNVNGKDSNNKKNEESKSMPTVITDYINDAVEKAGTEAKNAIVEAAAREVAVTIINVGVLITLFVISRIILMLVKGLAELLTKLPVIKQADKIGGIIYGLLQALVITYVILAIISFISPLVVTNTGITKAIQESYVGSMMYNNNLLLKIIF